MTLSFRILFARLEHRLARLGPAATVVALGGPSAAAAAAMNGLARAAEGAPVTVLGCCDAAVQTMIVVMPLVLYARRTILQLARSRTELKRTTKRLAAQARRARQSDCAKSAFLANMSHELRTPLNAILGFSEIMKEQHLGPISNARYLSYTADIHASGLHLLGIINDVLDLSKIEAGKMSLEGAEAFVLASALANPMAMLEGLGRKHGVVVTREWPGEEVCIHAVKRMIRQIVINLVGNAIKFTPAGGRVTLSGALGDDGGYTLYVRDTGVGMSRDEIARALIPFGQNRPKLTVAQEGTGLGLPLAKAMIELHGGTLAIDSRPDHGTTVALSFPPGRVVPRDRAAA